MPIWIVQSMQLDAISNSTYPQTANLQPAKPLTAHAVIERRSWKKFQHLVLERAREGSSYFLMQHSKIMKYVKCIYI